MYRILIVDNEPYVVDWIAALLEAQIDREIDVCRAYTAAEALEWLTRSRTDIVISDICMPRMSGLELAGQVKVRWPYARVILITAYAQFDYAVTAIQNNVAGYILKTQGDDVIVSEVERVMAMIDAELNQRSFGGPAADIQSALPELRSQFMRMLLEQEPEDTDKVNAQLESLKISMDADTPVRILLGAVWEWESLEDLVVRRQLAAKMIGQMNACLGDCGSLYPVDLGGSRMACLIGSLPGPANVPASDGGQAIKGAQESALLQGRLETLQDACAAGGVCHISFILYPQPVFLRDLHEAYRSLEAQMNRMTLEKDVFVILGKAEKVKRTVDPEVISRRLRLFLEEDRFDKFLEALSYYQALARDRRIDTGDCYNIYYSIALLINSYLENRQLPRTDQIRQMSAGLFDPPYAGQWTEKFEMLIGFSEAVFSTESELKAGISRNTVEALKRYVREHISEDISLTRLSEVTGYNTCYLSRIFRAQTGETLTEYIGKKKMDRIRDLMRDPDLNIGEIAEKTGFLSRTYFNRFVRKYTGMSPKNYQLSLVSINSLTERHSPSII